MNKIEYMAWLYEARRDIISRSTTEERLSNYVMNSRSIKRQNIGKWLPKVDLEIENHIKLLEL